MLASCIEPAAPNIRHCVDFVGCVVGDCDAVHIGCVHDSVLSLVLGIRHSSLICIGYHMYPKHTREFRSIFTKQNLVL